MVHRGFPIGNLLACKIPLPQVTSAAMTRAFCVVGEAAGEGRGNTVAASWSRVFHSCLMVLDCTRKTSGVLRRPLPPAPPLIFIATRKTRVWTLGDKAPPVD